MTNEKTTFQFENFIPNASLVLRSYIMKVVAFFLTFSLFIVHGASNTRNIVQGNLCLIDHYTSSNHEALKSALVSSQEITTCRKSLLPSSRYRCITVYIIIPTYVI